MLSHAYFRLAWPLWLACLSGCITPPSQNHPIPTKELVISGLKSPWSIAFINANEAIISQKEQGLVLAILDQATVTEIAGFPDDLVDDIRRVSRGDNGGVFDVVLDPNFDDNGYLYVAYAAKLGDGRTTKVIRATLHGTILTDIKSLLVATPYTPNEYFHYGGGLAFGADDKLYITVGERLFNEKDQPSLPIAQNLKDRRGKIYRLNTDGSIPEDNPSFGSEGTPGLYAIGIRAAQGITLNRETGDVWFSEHGTKQGDEINLLQPGANYGWPIKTSGGYRDENYVPPTIAGAVYTSPVWSWKQTVAPTGLTFYTGDTFPQWKGDLLVSGLSLGSFWRIDFEKGEIIGVEELFVNDRVRSRKVAMSPDGQLYMLTDTYIDVSAGKFSFTDGPSGALIRIVPSVHTDNESKNPDHD